MMLSGGTQGCGPHPSLSQPQAGDPPPDFQQWLCSCKLEPEPLAPRALEEPKPGSPGEPGRS